MQKSFLKRKAGGYSLIEVLASIILIGVGLVAVVGVFPMGLAHIRIMGERVFVVQQAQGQMEYFKRMTYSEISNWADSAVTFEFNPLMDLMEFANTEDPNTVKTTFPGYRSVAAFTKDAARPNVVHIKVEIYWVESTPYGKMTTQEKSYVLNGYKGVGVK